MRNSLFQNILFESQQQFTDLFQAEETFKPKLSAKKQLGTYKLCQLNGVDYVLIQEIGPTNQARYIIQFDKGWNMKHSLSDLLNPDAEQYEWWAVEIDEDEQYETSPEVRYLLDNFDKLIK